MKLLKETFYSGILLLSMILLVGCGSSGTTGGASNMKITLSGLSATTIEAGTQVSGTVQISADAVALNGIGFTIKTNNSFVTGSPNSDTIGDGSAEFILTASPLADLSKSVQVWAEYEGIKSNIVEVNLKSYTESSNFTFTMGDSIDYSRTVVTGTPGMTYNIVETGNQVQFTAPGGAIVSVPVEVSIDSINGYFAGDVVTVLTNSGYVSFTGINPTTSASFIINSSDGVAPVPTTYTFNVPAASSVADQTTALTYSVVWRAKVTYNGMVYYKTATTSVSAETTSQEPAD
jgi:hypothetical protein